MPNIKSQKKRVITNQKANDINVAKRTRVRNSVKKYMQAIEAKDVALAEELLKETVSLINRAKSDGIYKDNTASRKISRLSKQLDNLKKEAYSTQSKIATVKVAIFLYKMHGHIRLFAVAIGKVVYIGRVSVGFVGPKHYYERKSAKNIRPKERINFLDDCVSFG